MIKENILFFIKKNNIILNDDESYNSISNEIFKKNINCYTKYVNNYCKNRIVDNIKNLIFKKSI